MTAVMPPRSLSTVPENESSDIAPPAYDDVFADLPPIHDHIFPGSVTPLNFARMPDRHAGYLGQRERAEMTRQAHESAIQNPQIRASPVMAKILRQMNSVTSGWDVVLEKLGVTRAAATPHIHYVMAELGFGVDYAPWSDDMEFLSPPVLAPSSEPSDPPCSWIKLDSAQIADIQEWAHDAMAVERATQRDRRERVRAARQRMATELTALLARPPAPFAAVDAEYALPTPPAPSPSGLPGGPSFL